MKTVLLLTLVIALAAFGVSLAQEEGSQGKSAPMAAKSAENTAAAKDPAIERTRRQVKMLDDIYKGGIVLVTENYVDGDEDLPAGTAFKKLFEAASKNGWHDVRIIDATGEPYSDENVAVSDFEKRAIKALKAGETFVNETVTENDKRYLLAATPIPVVMEKCTMCHSNYDMEAKGLVVGALTYRVPVDE